MFDEETKVKLAALLLILVFSLSAVGIFFAYRSYVNTQLEKPGVIGVNGHTEPID